MPRILFGGPQEKERGAQDYSHRDLLARLRKEGIEVNYLTRGDEMMGELLKPTSAANGSYEAVVCDTRLFYDEARPAERARLFIENVAASLKKANVPVIVLADGEIAESISNSARSADFTLINQPYDVEEVFRAVKSHLA